MSVILDLERESDLGFGLSDQSVFNFRAKRRAVLLADYLLDEEGNFRNLNESIDYVLGHRSYNDGDITNHFVRVLQAIRSSPRLAQKIKSFGLPLSDPKLSEMIAITLDVEAELTDRHVIWAILSALLCPLRQSVGSCFATAPAILVHEEQMELFLDDMQQLLYKGHLTRVSGGVESTVPISPSPGIGELKKGYQPDHPGFMKAVGAAGEHEGKSYLEVLESLVLEKFELKKRDLTRAMQRHTPKLERIEVAKQMLQRAKWVMVAFSEHLLLKMWEFTLASFVDVKTEFSRWNLYSSLGLHPEEKGGIGELIYHHLQHILDEANKKVDHYSQEYEIAFDQVRATEQLLKGASSEADARRLKGEHQARVYHMYACLEMRDKWNQKAQNTSNFFSFLIEQIVAKFQEFFQEVYDAEMGEIKGTIYDDSPAGFRLVYKNRRAHVGSWTFIHTKEEYIQALKDFFLAIENPLIEGCKWEEGKGEISRLITAIIHLVSAEEFLVSAFYRMAKAHRVPLQKVDLEKMEKKPWAYTSGGTIVTLLKTYFRREGSLSEEARWVDSAQDLLIFIIETLKMLPPMVTDPFLRDPEKRMLMTGPTHAFLLLPGKLKQGWEDRGFTYTWVRDQVFLPGREFYDAIRLQSHEQLYLIDELANRLPLLQGHELRGQFQPSSKPLTIAAFREKLPKSPAIDGFLFEMLPLVNPTKFLEKLGLKIPIYAPVGRRVLHDQIVAAAPQIQSVDFHLELANLMEKEGLAPPKPLIFADTNWSKFYFSFLVNPASGELELWRTDKLGLTGVPMNEWEPFLNGTIKEHWGIFCRPHEYLK
ncbi:MAG: hypothetical protein JSS30_00435 [Verrucomicrobia bacterium]|nr:hypothetical protein [Verrucomicrobiota bacterium]